MKTWFYNGFVKRHELSYARIAGASRKLPFDWREKWTNNVNIVANTQQYQRKSRNSVPPILDENFANTDHIPFYRDMTGSY